MRNIATLLRRSLPGLLAITGLAVLPSLGHCQGGGSGGITGFGSSTGVRRATGLLANPVQFAQKTQMTGTGATVGTVRIYNMFGVLYMQSAFGGAFGGSAQAGGGGGYGGYGGGGGGGGVSQSQGLVGSGMLPGIGSSSQGDDPPAGVMLHVNYAQLFNPGQSQLQQNTALSGGLGGVQGLLSAGGGGGGGFGFGGKGFYGNGGNGL